MSISMFDTVHGSGAIRRGTQEYATIQEKQSYSCDHQLESIKTRMQPASQHTAPLPHARYTYRFYQWAWAGIELLFPPRCAGCGQHGARWCTDCQGAVQRLGGALCSICGVELNDRGLCTRCLNHHPPFQALRAWGYFHGPLRAALHRLKYKGDLALGATFAAFLSELLEEQCWQVDLVVPVPLGARRQHERGYNQAALLAWPVAASLGLNYNSRLLVKVRQTRSQVGLSVPERRLNVAGAFSAGPQAQAKTILVVDDVVTSGATMEACAQALISAGARSVYGLCLCRTGKLCI